MAKYAIQTQLQSTNCAHKFEVGVPNLKLGERYLGDSLWESVSGRFISIHFKDPFFPYVCHRSF